MTHGHSCQLAPWLVPWCRLPTNNMVVAFFDETRRGARDCAGDLAHLPAVRLPAHVDSTVDQAAIEFRRLWRDGVKPSGTDQRTSLIPRLRAAPSSPSSPASPALSASSVLFSSPPEPFSVASLKMRLPRRSVYRAWGSYSAATSACSPAESGVLKALNESPADCLSSSKL